LVSRPVLVDSTPVLRLLIESARVIVALAAHAVGDQLHGDQHKEQRHSQQNQVHGRRPQGYPRD
jgi:hypothetical protein